ncbi:MAG: FecR domain-containing protein [Spirochaetota bacterium]
MKKREKKRTVSAAFLIAVLSLISCSHSVKNGVVSAADGTVLSGGAPVSSGFVLYPEVSLAAGAHSYAAVQIEDKGIIVLYPDTEISLFENGLCLLRGEISLQLDKSEKLCVRTPGAEAYYKGSRSIVSAADGSAQFKLFSGSCRIVPVTGGKPDDDREFELREGCSADVIEGRAGSHFPLKETDLKDFAFLAAVQPAADPANADPLSVIPFAARDILLRVSGEALSSEFQLKKLAMEKGPLRTVTLRDGRKIVGSMSVQGRMTDIETVNGKVSVPSKQVKNVSIYQ